MPSGSKPPPSPLDPAFDPAKLSDDELESIAWDLKERAEQQAIAMPYTLYEPLRARGHDPDKYRRFHECDARVRFVHGGNRCIGPDTIVSLDGRRVSEIFEPFDCLSWNGLGFVRARAGVPFVKGTDRLYLVEFTNGQALVATLSHRILTLCGYATVAELRSRLRRGLRDSIVALGQSIHGVDALRSSETFPDSLAGIDAITPYSPRQEQFWDFEVPGFHNYVAGGCVNHNSGKSYMSLMEAIWHLVGWYPDYYPDYVKSPVPARVRIASTADAFDDRIWPFLKRFIPGPKNKSAPVRIVHEDIRKKVLNLSNGSHMQGKTFEQDLVEFMGDEIHFCVFDEHCKYPKKFTESMMRLLSANGRMVVDLCPFTDETGGGFSWEYDALYLPSLQDDSRIKRFVYSMHDNPLLSQTDIEEFLAGLNPHERAAREEGDFIRPGGLVFKEYRDREPWLCEPVDLRFNEKDNDFYNKVRPENVWTLDPASTRPNSVLATWAYPTAIHGLDRLRLVGQIWKDCTVEDLVHEMYALAQKVGTPREVIIDFASKEAERTSGVSFLSMLSEHLRGWTRIRLSVKKNEMSHLARIREMFMIRDDAKPAIQVCKDLGRVRYELTHFGYKENGELEDENGDFVDCLRYRIATMRGREEARVIEPQWMTEARAIGNSS